MSVPFKVIEIINIIALLFLLTGGYGLPVTGALQVLAASFFLITFPKNKLIYIYFGLVILFFCFGTEAMTSTGYLYFLLF